MFAVIDLNIELALNAVVDKHARLDVHVVVLVIPVCLESDRDAVPALWVSMTEAITTDLDNALGHDVRLLVQVDVMLIGVVEGAHCTN